MRMAKCPMCGQHNVNGFKKNNNGIQLVTIRSADILQKQVCQHVK